MHQARCHRTQTHTVDGHGRMSCLIFTAVLHDRWHPIAHARTAHRMFVQHGAKTHLFLVSFCMNTNFGRDVFSRIRPCVSAARCWTDESAICVHFPFSSFSMHRKSEWIWVWTMNEGVCVMLMPIRHQSRNVEFRIWKIIHLSLTQWPHSHSHSLAFSTVWSVDPQHTGTCGITSPFNIVSINNLYLIRYVILVSFRWYVHRSTRSINWRRWRWRARTTRKCTKQ